MPFAVAQFLPETLIPLLLVSGGFALIIGARRFAGAVFLLAVIMLVAPVIVEPLIDALPWWLVVVLVAWAGIAMLRAIAALLIGRRPEQHMTGALAAYTVRWLWLAPFRMVRWLFTRFL